MNKKHTTLRGHLFRWSQRMALAMLAIMLLSGCWLGPNRERHADIRRSVSDMYDTVFNWYNNHRDDWRVEHDFDERYLTPSYAALQREAGGIGMELNEAPPGMDYDHWVQAQDWEEMSYSVDSIGVHSEGSADVHVDSIYVHSEVSADVYVTIKNGDYRTPLLLKMKYVEEPPHLGKSRWQIDDFVTKERQGGSYSVSAREAMEEYVRQYNKEAARRGIGNSDPL